VAEFRLLGPLEVVEDGAVLALGSGRQRALLALLLLNRNEVLSVDRIVDALWADTPPPTATKIVQVYVAGLRKVLGEERLRTQRPGYVLRVEPGEVDVERVEQLREQAREAEPRRAAELLRAALAQWRGGPLADLVYDSFAQLEIARLEELRLALLEERVDADLVLGRHADLVPELESLVARHPLRERFREQLMLALYRCGRQADALDVYQDGRRRLREELGLEPAPPLRDLERAILNHDPSLATAPRAGPRPAPRGSLLLLAGGVLLASAAAAATVLLVRSSGSGSERLEVAPDSLAVIDRQRNRLNADLPIGSAPVAVAAGKGTLWVADAGDQTLAQVDPTSKEVVDRVGIGWIPTQMAFGAGRLWIASAVGERGVLVEVDPATASVVSTRTVRVGFGRGDDAFAPPTPSAIAVASRSVWANELHSRLRSVPTAGGPTREIDLGASHSVDGVAAGEGSIWVASGADDHVLRLDPRSGRVEAEIAIAAAPAARIASPYSIAVGAGAVWVSDTLADAVSRIDPRLNAVTATIKVGKRPTRLAVGRDAVWVLNASDGTVSRIDPARATVTATVPVARGATSLAAAFGRVWVTVAGGKPHTLAASTRPSFKAVAGGNCSNVQAGRGRPDRLIVSDLPTFRSGPTPDPRIQQTRAAIVRVLREHRFRAGRYRLGYQACDDSSPQEGPSPERCAANGHAYALDASLIGVIGAYNSFCTGIELPLLNAAPGGPISVVSPSNTYVGLTHAGPATAADEPDRYYPTGARNFVRLLASDDDQSAAIDLFLHQLGRHRLYLLDDGEGTGYAGANYAREAAAMSKLKIAGAAAWAARASNYRSLATRIAHAHADAVLLSGCICSNGRRLVADLRAVLGRNVTLIGTDNFTGIGDFLGPPARVFDGLYISTAGRPPQDLPLAGKRFLTRLTHRPLPATSALPAYAAQATATLLDAIARSDGTRTSITRQLLATQSRASLIGQFSSSPTGDPEPAAVAIYRVNSRLPYRPDVDVQGLAFDREIEFAFS
jgi:YVTN family beta-propeller protein